MKTLKKGLAAISDQTIAMMAGAVVLATITLPAMNAFARDQAYSVGASHAVRVEKAVSKYILEQSATVGAVATDSSPYVIEVPLLISKGYLPAGFAPQNNFSATYRTLVYQPSAQKFHSMTFLEGGIQLSMSGARKLATRIGDNGGVIENGVARGVQGLWSENLAAFGGVNPGDARVVMAGFFSNGSVVNDYLYRKSVPGHPELNTMSTALNMGGNDINAAKNVTAAGNIEAGNTITAGGWFKTRGDTGWHSEKWGGGWHMTDGEWLRAYGGKSISTTGIVKAATFQPEEVNKVDKDCPQNGRISRDDAGGLLSCKNRKWQSAGSTINFAATVYQYVGDGGRCPANHVLTGVGGFYATYTAGYIYCAPVN